MMFFRRIEQAVAHRGWRSSAAFIGHRPGVSHRHHWVSQNSSSFAKQSLSLSANRDNNAHNWSRPMPPQLDDWAYQDDFGGYDFQPDIYDLEDMQNEEYIVGDDGIMYPKPAKKETTKPNHKGTPATASSDSPSSDMATLGKNDTIIIVKETLDTSDVRMSESTDEEEIQASEVPQEGTSTKAIGSIIDERGPPPGTNGYRKDSEFFKRASSGTGVSTSLDQLEDQLGEYKRELIIATNNTKFNPNSPRQISWALYGYGGETTNKDVLEAMAANGNHIADLVMKYRTLSGEINKRKKKVQSREKGTYASSVLTVKRTNPTLKGDFDPMTPREHPNATVGTSIVSEDPLLLVDASAYIFRA